MKLTIADGLKYVEWLKERLAILKRKIEQTDVVKITQKVISNWTDTSIVEAANYAISPAELTGEYDKTAKEIRLVQQAIERANHTVYLDIKTKY